MTSDEWAMSLALDVERGDYRRVHGMGHAELAQHGAELLRQRRAQRCGSYPFFNIAEDFGLPYGVVLRRAERRNGGQHAPLTDQEIIERALPDPGRVIALDEAICAVLVLPHWPSIEKGTRQ